MRCSTRLTSLTAILSVFSGFVSQTSATALIESEALEVCQVNSGLTASLFQVVFTPVNNTIAFNIVGISTITGNVTADVYVTAYGYQIIEKSLDPCELNLSGFCPLTAEPIDIDSNYVIDGSITDIIPGIAYTIPNLDGVVKIKVNDKNTGVQVACVQAQLSNGKTVYQKGVGWATAVVAGLALFVSAIASGLGHSNTAAHIAANAMSLFGFFQAQALIGMTAVDLPPIASAWTQNFQWSMGIIQIGFIQNICTWYQQATGGTPSTVLSTLSTTSVNVAKRSLPRVTDLAARAARGLSYNNMVRRSPRESSSFPLMPRASNDTTNDVNNIITVRGIQRVGFRADIELTNIFLTGYIFFIIFIGFVVLALVLFRWILEALSKSGKIRSDKFVDFRNGWTTVIRGVLFRLVLIGFIQMVVLCFWELASQDSAAEMALAAITICTMLVMLSWACLKVYLLAKRSIAMHKNPAYILYSDPVCLHKWGFLYVQFKATAYWFIMPYLLYLLIKGLFVAFGQDSGVTQAIAFVILEAALLIGTSILRPYMDKKTNAFNISIAAINLVSAIFLLFFTDIFGLPGLVVGVMGVVFFIMNAVFALVLLIMVLVAMAYAIFTKNPDVRYQPMRDDRGSFIKSQSQLTTELDALGATARGEAKTPFKNRDIDEDSYSSSSWDDRQGPNGSGNLGHYSQIAQPYNKEVQQTHATPTAYDGSPYANGDSVRSNRSNLNVVQPPSRSQTVSPWQKGAGYDR